MKILEARQIAQKIRRLAIQILEQHYGENQIFLAGINNNGFHFAELLQEQLHRISEIPVYLFRIRLNPAEPAAHPVQIDFEAERLSGQRVILVDDVANTGRTLFYACKPLLDIVPGSIEVAVLIDRKHKSFPIHVDYVGLSLATTLREHIDVRLGEEHAVYLN